MKSKIICKIFTLGRHWWKHYPGEKRYVRCRLCGRLPKNIEKFWIWTWKEACNINGKSFERGE